jgi:hypothetical protein
MQLQMLDALLIKSIKRHPSPNNKEKLAHIMKLFPSFLVDKLAKMPG